MADTDRIGLPELIQDLREALGVALAAGAGESLRFQLGPVQIEATVSAERDQSAGGKVRFWLVEAGRDGREHSTRTQRISLTLEPRLAAPDGSLRTVSIVSQEAPGER